MDENTTRVHRLPPLAHFEDGSHTTKLVKSTNQEFFQGKDFT